MVLPDPDAAIETALEHLEDLERRFQQSLQASDLVQAAVTKLTDAFNNNRERVYESIERVYKRIEALGAAVVKPAGCADATTRFDELERQADWKRTYNAALTGLLAGNAEETLGMDGIREQAAGEADFRHGPLADKP